VLARKSDKWIPTRRCDECCACLHPWPIAFSCFAVSRDQRCRTLQASFDRIDLLLIGKAQPRPTSSPKTMADALELLAKMGGHIKNNGPPGWMTLGAGYEKLVLIKLGFQMGRDFD
jgi:hypothetical protein